MIELSILSTPCLVQFSTMSRTRAELRHASVKDAAKDQLSLSFAHGGKLNNWAQALFKVPTVL